MKTSSIPMRSIRTLAFCLLATVLVALPSNSLRLIRTITPDSKEESGFTVKYKRAKEGAYSFIVTRHNVFTAAEDLTNEKVIDAPMALQTDYKADLEVRKGDKLIVRTTVAGQKQETNLVYVFEIARDCIKDSRFSLAENYEGKATEHLRTFGEICQVDLKEIDRRIEASIPQHP